MVEYRIGVTLRVLAAILAAPALAFGLYILAASMFGVHFLWMLLSICASGLGVMFARVAWTGYLPTWGER